MYRLHTSERKRQHPECPIFPDSGSFTTMQEKDSDAGFTAHWRYADFKSNEWSSHEYLPWHEPISSRHNPASTSRVWDFGLSSGCVHELTPERLKSSTHRICRIWPGVQFKMYSAMCDSSTTRTLQLCLLRLGSKRGKIASWSPRGRTCPGPRISINSLRSMIFGCSLLGLMFTMRMRRRSNSSCWMKIME